MPLYWFKGPVGEPFQFQCGPDGIHVPGLADKVKLKPRPLELNGVVVDFDKSSGYLSMQDAQEFIQGLGGSTETAIPVDGQPAAATVPAAAAAPVPALEVVRSTYKYWPINSPSISTHQRSYDKLQMVKWDLRNVEESRAVCSYVEERLESVAMTADPRTNTESHPEPLDNESQCNIVFHSCVGQVVAAVLCSLGLPMAFQVFPSTNVANGLPDFMVTHGGSELVTGEGKTPAVMRSIVDIVQTEQPNIYSCAEQACCYIRDRKHRYGFLTYLQATFFIKRLARDTYAFTMAVPFSAKEPSVREMLAYIILKSLEEGAWVDGEQAAPGAIPASVLDQDITQALPAAASVQQLPRRSPRLEAPTAHQGHQGQQCGYPHHSEAALLLSDTSLGMGQTGMVRLASFNGTLCAVKMADTCKQRELVRILQNEVAAYGCLSALQGTTIPVLHGCGYWRSGGVFFLATSYIKGHHPDPTMGAALSVAEKALRGIHDLGLVHGDVRMDNILLQQASDGTYKVWFLDLGHAHVPDGPEACIHELGELRALFRASDQSDASDAGYMKE